MRFGLASKLYLLTASLLASTFVIIGVGAFFEHDLAQSTAKISNEYVPFAGTARQMKLDAVQVQQWLTDISATRGLDGLNDGFDMAAEHHQSFLDGAGSSMRRRETPKGSNVSTVSSQGSRTTIPSVKTWQRPTWPTARPVET